MAMGAVPAGHRLNLFKVEGAMSVKKWIKSAGSVSGFGLIASLICVAFILFPGCVSKSSYNKVQNDLTTCSNQLQEAQVEVQEQGQAAVISDTFYQTLVSAMQDEIQTNQLTIKQMQTGVSVNLPAAVLFPSGSADVNTEGVSILTKVAKQLKAVPYQTIVAGFTDNVPIGGKLAELYPTNWELAAARAAEVASLLQKEGIPRERLLVVSFGENDPVAPNDTPEGRAKNRRIEIRLRPVPVFKQAP